MTEAAVLRMVRTDEEKKRRSLQGDSGAKFSQSRQYEPRTDQISNTITSVQKDNLLVVPIIGGGSRQDRIGYKWRENGGIRCFDTEKGTNISEWQIYSPNVVAPVLTSCNSSKVYVLLKCETENKQ